MQTKQLAVVFCWVLGADGLGGVLHHDVCQQMVVLFILISSSLLYKRIRTDVIAVFMLIAIK